MANSKTSTAASKRKAAERKSTLPQSPVPKAERIPKKMGRPTTCTPEVKAEALWYAQGGWELVGDAFPSMVGLACELGVTEPRLYEWAGIHDDFSEIMAMVRAGQQRTLLTGGAKGKLNPVITKLVLGKHGYHDKVDSAMSNPDGSMRQQPTKVVITGRKPRNQDGDTDD